MLRNRYERAKYDVGKVFARPQEIADAGDLLSKQKIDLLKQLELDLRELLVVSEESMVSSEPGQAAELLRSVRGILMSLGAAEPKLPHLNKSGG